MYMCVCVCVCIYIYIYHMGQQWPATVVGALGAADLGMT